MIELRYFQGREEQLKIQLSEGPFLPSGPLLYTTQNWGSTFGTIKLDWEGGPFLAAKCGPGGPFLANRSGPGSPLLAAKSGPGGHFLVGSILASALCIHKQLCSTLVYIILYVPQSTLECLYHKNPPT